jgi:hypothetical protein
MDAKENAKDARKFLNRKPLRSLRVLRIFAVSNAVKMGILI